MVPAQWEELELWPVVAEAGVVEEVLAGKGSPCAWR